MSCQRTDEWSASTNDPPIHQEHYEHSSGEKVADSLLADILEVSKLFRCSGPDTIRLKRILNDSEFEHKITPNERSLIVPNEDRYDSSSTCMVLCQGIPNTVFEDEIIELFDYEDEDEEIEIYEFRLIMNPKTEENYGIAFILFKNTAAADKSVKKLNNYEIREGYKLQFYQCDPNLKSVFLEPLPSEKCSQMLKEIKDLSGVSFDENSVHVCIRSTAVAYCSCIKQMLKDISSIKEDIKKIKIGTSKSKIEKADELNRALYAHHSLQMEEITSNENSRRNIMEASEYALKLENDVTLQNITEIHTKICPELKKEGELFRHLDVCIPALSGRIHWSTPPAEVEKEMDAWRKMFEELLQHLDSIEDGSAIIKAVELKWIFLLIHPFVDGNGRSSRAIFGSILKRLHFPWIVIPADDSTRYYEAIEALQVTDTKPNYTLLFKFICHCIYSTLCIYKKCLLL